MVEFFGQAIDKPEKEKATGIEFRSPDPASNPDLCLAVQPAAGLAGIEGNYPLLDPDEEDIFEMTLAEGEGRGINSFPGNLYAAVEELKKSSLVREALGEHIFNKFIANKKRKIWTGGK